MIKFEKRKIKMKWKKIKSKYHFNIIWSRIIWFGLTQWDEMIKSRKILKYDQICKEKEWNEMLKIILLKKFKKWRSEKMDIRKKWL